LIQQAHLLHLQINALALGMRKRSILPQHIPPPQATVALKVVQGRLSLSVIADSDVVGSLHLTAD